MDTRKIIQALAFFASKQEDSKIDNIKAFKLLWLTDRYHVRHYGRTVSGDSYYAMPKGLVPSDAKSLLENQVTHLRSSSEPVNLYIAPRKWFYTLTKMPNMKVFSKTDMEALNKVLDAYNSMSGKELSDLSHNFPEWKHYEAKLKDDKENNSFPINMELMFENYDDGKGLFMDSNDLLSVTKEVYFSHYGH